MGGGTGRRRRRSMPAEEGSTSSAGCMTAVFHLFDLNHCPQQQISYSKGVEAPRNSLTNSELKINQIKTRDSRTEDLASNSPGTKTPNVVARLMGLDLLPECSSPSSNPTKSHLHKNRCSTDDDTRSVPDTVRTSSSRRSDVDHHHRLSLQINKERINECFTWRRFRKQDENSNGVTKQIVKQVKESVSRRVGLLDITNTNRSNIVEHRRDQDLLPEKSPRLTPKLDPQISPNLKKQTAQSFSPKLRFSDAKKWKPVTETSTKSPMSASFSVICSSKYQEPDNDCRKPERRKGCITKKLSNQNVDRRMRNKEAFVRSAKSPLSSELVQKVSGPSLLPVKKDPSPPATRLPPKQVSSSTSKRNTHLSSNTIHLHNLPTKLNSCAAAPDYKSYVTKILRRAGIVDKFTTLTLGKWHTPSHPLDPSIFYYLELCHTSTATSDFLSSRSNRKLIFQLVDEILAEILRPNLNSKSGGFLNNDYFCLDDELSKRIESYPAANCKVLEDIDALVDKDLCNSPSSGGYWEEKEGLVCEIEGEIVELLVCETMVFVGRLDVR